jgi:hypothetical protein
MSEPKQYTIECAVEDLGGIASDLRRERDALNSIRCLLTGGPQSHIEGGDDDENGYVHNLERLVGEIRNVISEISNERQVISGTIERPKAPYVAKADTSGGYVVMGEV